MQASSQAIRQIRDATALDSMLVERRNADPADSVQGSSVPASEALCAAFARSFLRDIGTQSPLSRITRLCADAAQKIPCLKENSEADKNVPIQTKDFVKFLGIVIILFCGFLTTFTMLARGEFSARQMLWTMINVSRQPTGYTRLQS